MSNADAPVGSAHLTVGRVADMVDGKAEGDLSVRISGISGLHGAQAGDLSFVADARYARLARMTQASALLVPTDLDMPDGCAAVVIRVSELGAALERLAETFQPPQTAHTPGVHPTAVVGADVVLGENVAIGPCAVIEDGAVLGDNTTIGPQVFVGRSAEIGADTTLDAGVKVGPRCVIGRHVTLHYGVAVGADGFGYVLRGRRHEKIPQIGIVVIGDDVEIGANSTVDRARFGATRIGRGTKIDDQVMVAHNVQIGEHCIITGHCGIAGSAVLGDYVMLGAQAGINGHVQVGDRAMVAGRAGVSKDVPAGAAVMGMPAAPVRAARRREAAGRRLPELLRAVKALKKQLDALSSDGG